MEILSFTRPVAMPGADLKVMMDAPLPVETLPEVPADFALVQLLERSTKALSRNVENMLRCQPNNTKVVGEPLAGNSVESLVAEFVEQMVAKRIRSEMWAHQARQCVAVMRHCQKTLLPGDLQKLEAKQDFILGDLKSNQASPAEIADEFYVIVKSSNDFFDKLLELIDLIKNGYLAGYEHIIAAYSDFFADFNKEITAKMKEWIEGANDGKEVKLNAGMIRLALQALIEKYSKAPAGVLFPAPGMEGASKEAAEKWRVALGLPESCLKDNGNGTFSVVMDLGPLKIMMDSLPSNVYWITWDTSKFQAWQTGFNAQEERLKNMLQSFTQKYSNANSYHDNFNKTLSSHLNQYADMLKAMLNF
ncbi:type III effector protein SipD [Pseudomonas fluorescens HK44]|uniref:Type III effector protein SipD n=1 Tax=Pseudomonas fluorescens HK44 TaxID=1042209 RepID=A0A010S6L8_PSEFL|nr:IpaD/SipD/SspD family type III secretion system needle tip protein [Pseudomonas fluorescens]EXF96154.1 type III effector protein SipD [Pseudomonas fluorescens HK44]